MSAAIGILAGRDDIHALAVQRKLEQRHRARCHILPGKELAIAGGLSWTSDRHEASVLRSSDGELVDVASLDAFWFRRMPATQILPEAADPEYATDIHLACESAIIGLLLNEFPGRWVSHPLASLAAENKLVQLRAAQHAGLRIPATLVSQDPERIRRFCRTHAGAILKPIRSRGELAITAVVGDELLAAADVLSLAPAIYQECIPGERHLRVTMFGDRAHAALISARELDWRVDMNVPFTRHELSHRLHASLVQVLTRLGLTMGVFDLKLTPEGDVVFLEVNPQGQFLFVEGMCGLPIAESLADYLVEQAVRHQERRELPVPERAVG